ncbi:MAG: hypothetical protein ASARMPRED_001551 [Alectoria sarmentosa]|nr:MAG: hypothetical protein ASARMPRED_001551 [Alectoria sarmentosa]
MESDVDLEAMSTAPRRLEGYPTFAEFVAKDRDAAIYRSFKNLSARNLLYQQSELHDLERQLEELDAKDANDIGDLNAQKAARLWTHYANDTNEQAIARRKLQKIIRKRIKEYCMYFFEQEIVFASDNRETDETMALESQILSLNSPSSRTLRDFKRWFTSSSMTVLWGRDKHLLDNENDLVALAPVDTDRLNLFLKSYFGWFFQVKQERSKEQRRNRTLPPKSELFYFPSHRIQRAGAVISVFLSAILLLGAIVCLTAVSNQSTSVRVGMIVLFTCLFAAVVGLLTNARRAEIFGSTAA